MSRGFAQITNRHDSRGSLILPPSQTTEEHCDRLIMITKLNLCCFSLFYMFMSSSSQYIPPVSGKLKLSLIFMKINVCLRKSSYRLVSDIRTAIVCVYYKPLLCFVILISCAVSTEKIKK